MDQEEVSILFRRYGMVSVPVIDEHGRLIGMITIDDIIDVIDEEAEEDLMALAGVGDTNVRSSLIETLQGRSSWLLINLVTAIVASAVIGLFDATIERLVALAVLMPIVASMGGIAGTQSLTILIRAMAMGQINHRNELWLIGRESLVGLLNGLLWAAVIAITASLWFGDPMLGVIIACAMLINLVTAGVTGAGLPIVLRKLHIDPALAGGVLVTTVTDVMGFLAFLGLATAFYA